MIGFVIGFVSGCVFVVVVCVVSAHLADKPARQEARLAHTARQQAAFRDWCEQVRWCPVHNVEDGACPRVEVPTYLDGYPAYRYKECPGSAVLRAPATPTLTGTRLETETVSTHDGVVWEYSVPPAS